MREHVRITDVSPRDGLQNEPGIIPTTDKKRLIDLLARTGVDEIELTSFVSPRWVPQLADAEQLLHLCDSVRAAGDHAPVFSALVPNEKGLLAALDAGRSDGRRILDKVAVFTAASEGFSRKNTNASIAETLERFAPVVTQAKAAGLATRGYVSCVVACPVEGPVEPEQVASVCVRLARLGVDEIDLGDTIGAATAPTIREVLLAVRSHLADAGLPRAITLHLHDTFGHAADCVRAALDVGVRSFDGSVAGLGGCPYASTPQRRAPGNIATELLCKVVHAAGFKTGVDLERLADAAAFARSLVAPGRRQG